MMSRKKNEYDDSLIDLARLAKALSHPARIAILLQIAKMSTCNCGDITKVIPLAQSTVSQHLKELKNAGLVIMQIKGQRSLYCINQDKVEALANGFTELVKSLQEKRSCC